LKEEQDQKEDITGFNGPLLETMINIPVTRRQARFGNISMKSQNRETLMRP
jgi:hypothetical protein